LWHSIDVLAVALNMNNSCSEASFWQRIDATAHSNLALSRFAAETQV